MHVASVCTPCCMLLDVAACCCAKFETGQTFQPTTPTILLFRDRRSVAQQCWIRLHSSSNIVGATHITHGLQRLMGCILPTMHCRSQHCWELLHPFAHHRQHARSNNSQHRWELLRPFARSLRTSEGEAVNLLADLLENRELIQRAQLVMVCICDWWISIRFVCFSVSRFVAFLTKSNTILNVFLSYFCKLFLTCFVK